MDTRYILKGKPGDWLIFLSVGNGDLELVDRVANRGHALTILKGLMNPIAERRVRYTWRKVYRYLKAMGWKLELNQPPDVYWCHPGSGIRLKENRQLTPKRFLLACYTCVPGTDKETLKAYWTWHKEHATT